MSYLLSLTTELRDNTAYILVPYLSFILLDNFQTRPYPYVCLACQHHLQMTFGYAFFLY